jgi:hypothetical protein
MADRESPAARAAASTAKTRFGTIPRQRPSTSRSIRGKLLGEEDSGGSKQSARAADLAQPDLSLRARADIFLRATADKRCRCARNAKECRDGGVSLQGRQVCKRNRTFCKLGFRRKFMNNRDMCCRFRQSLGMVQKERVLGGAPASLGGVYIKHEILIKLIATGYKPNCCNGIRMQGSLSSRFFW